MFLSLPLFAMAENGFVQTLSESQDLIPLPRTREDKVGKEEPRFMRRARLEGKATVLDPLSEKPAPTGESKYLAGAVPEENGIVTFRQTFYVLDKNRKDTYPIMLEYAKSLVAGSVPNSLRARVINDDPQAGNVVVKVEEYMTFKKKFLNLDRAQFRFLFSAECSDGGKVTMTLTQISYGYEEDGEGKFHTTYKAEEWITDKEAINKSGKKLYPRSGKFRRFTVDRVEKIFDNARNLFEEQKKITDKKKVDALVGE